MENKQKPENFFLRIQTIVKLILHKLSKSFDRLVFNKRGSMIISFVIAAALCVSIDYQTLSVHLFNDNTTTANLSDVPVTTKIDEENYLVDGVPATVDVSITGNATDIQVFRQQGNISVVADMLKLTEGKNIVDLRVNNLPSSLSATIDPASIEVNISRKVSKQFSVTPELVVGPNQDASDFKTPVLNTDTVTITASQDQLNSIRSVKAIVDTNGQSQDFEGPATLVAYDSKGNRVNVEIDPDTILAKVSLNTTEIEE